MLHCKYIKINGKRAERVETKYILNYRLRRIRTKEKDLNGNEKKDINQYFIMQIYWLPLNEISIMI